MKNQYKKSFAASILAVIVGTSCCWLSTVAIWIGGAASLGVASQFIEGYQGIILSVAFLFLLTSAFQFWKYKKKKSKGINALLFLIILPASLLAQASNKQSNQIIGQWKTHDQRAIIEIYEYNNTYQGKIIWLKKPNNAQGNARQDIQNPIREKQKQPLMGLVVLKNFEVKNGKYINGTAYDPDSGGTYNCKLWLSDLDTLKVRDYCGVFYKTFTWVLVAN